MLKNVMLEGDMEQYLIDNSYNIFENKENLLDSTLVVEHAIDLGYESYMIYGSGSFDETLIFIKKVFNENEDTVLSFHYLKQKRCNICLLQN